MWTPAMATFMDRPRGLLQVSRLCQSSARVRLDSKLTAVKTCTAEPDVRETQRGSGFPQFDDKSEQHAELDYQGRTATC